MRTDDGAIVLPETAVQQYTHTHTHTHTHTSPKKEKRNRAQIMDILVMHLS